MHNVVLSPIDPEILINSIAERVTASILNAVKIKQPTETPDRWFNVDELCNYLPDKPAKQTIYGKVSSNEIPHYKDAKKLRFLKSEIDNWLKQGKKKNIADFANDADTFLTNNKKGCKNGK